MRYWMLLFLAGCMGGPHYSPPEIQMSDEWTGEKPPEIAEEPLVKWWEVFEDPLLNKYIAAAEKYNYDLLTAEANILRARAIRQMAASSLFPQVNADFIPMRLDLSKTGPFFNGLEGIGGTGPFARVFNLFSAFFDASWELDLFGKTRHAVQQAEAMVDSAIEQKNGLLIATFAELARNYMELRSYQAKKQLIEQNIAFYEENTAVVGKNFDAGYSTQLEWEKTKAKLETAKAELPEVIAEIYRSIYTLSILIGELPEKLLDELKEPQPLLKAPEKVAVGLRSDLLRRRPDVRRAEKDLAAATANVGVAVASFFPTISLFGAAGFQSEKIHELFDWKSKLWTYGADFNMPVYQGGKIVGNLRFTQAEQSAAAFTYHQVILNAIQDAESSLIAYKQQAAAAAALSRAVSSLEQGVRISAERFAKGLVNKIDLLQSEIELVQARLHFLARETDSLLSLLSLYKALGGGWQI